MVKAELLSILCHPYGIWFFGNKARRSHEVVSPTVLEAIKSAWEEHFQVDTEDGESPTSGKNL